MAEVELEPHDPAWRERFECERDRILDVAGDELLGVFHVGSTAVPDLPAKPTLDVLAVFDGYESARSAGDALVDDGYEPERDRGDWVGLSRNASDYAVYVHLRPRDDRTWREQVALRNLLRADLRARAEYERAKRRAVAAHPDDVDAYTDAKEATVLSLVEQARESGYADRLPTLEDS